MDLVIRDGRVVTTKKIISADVGVEDGVIVAVGSRGSLPKGKQEIDATSRYVLPGTIDPHVHFRDPGFPEKEDFHSGSLAAVTGGVTTVLDMPNTNPPVMDAASLLLKRKMIERRSFADFGLLAALDETNLDRAQEMADSGAVAFKVFTCQRPNPPPAGICDKSSLLMALRAATLSGLPVCVHAEKETVVRAATARLQDAGRSDALAYAEARPVEAEVEAIHEIVTLARETGTRLHICHVSTMGGAAQVAQAKQNGLAVTLEVCPQHLLLDDSYYPRLGSRLKMTPPIRAPEEAAGLWRALSRGAVDLIATDHAPHTEAQKTEPDIWRAASGFSGVETRLPLLLTEVTRRRLTLQSCVRLLAEAPARIFGLWPRKGGIQIGSDGDFIVVDLDRRSNLQRAALRSRSKTTPFEGWEARGLPLTTVLRGQLIVEEGEVVSEPKGVFLWPQSERVV